ncbi:ATP-binding cassette domain-containing protein [Streptomyces scopuliridis]|uniref:ATP-binding cassette domain-containing protein n=1 Tax=Streptomyces scopuliridis TaxID=452529 RepID=A0ACD4ZCM0_9ACTN|nr:oligopeptide/dipeptide ABC transporter ATP-binding protein [Streptomyces scopuliridis]WSB31471.1 ATP-binding cassette domain-containing protein [Streptomyces scopuliridis]WSB95718.1 ATP-binding cassette domain-containing protein [Streptomyces scopuliridis]WSC10575.1 ATP-binding cassette domain-containing protein [Streptomyces scopuliridis]
MTSPPTTSAASAAESPPPARPGTPLIRAEKLRVEYRGRSGGRVRALRDIDLEIVEGETLGLVGESGCGKSTLGRALLRVIEPVSGTIDFLGLNITGLSGPRLRRTRADLQMVFQDPFGSLNPRRRIADIVAEPLLRARGASRAEAGPVVRELLERVGLGAEAGWRKPHEFSGGQRQRIGIARALASSPKFVVADEAVSALDVSIQAQVLNLLTDTVRERGLTMLFISHDLGVVRHIADRVAVMYLGQIIEIASRDDFFSGPAHPYSDALLSSVPSLRAGGRRERRVLEGELPDPANPPDGCLFQTRCPFAEDECRTRMPELREVAPGRTVRCHLPLVPTEKG